MKFLLIISVTLFAGAFAQHQAPSQNQQQHLPAPPAPHQQQQYQRTGNEIIDEDNAKLRTTTWIPILEYNKEQGQDGSYKTSYKTGNDIDASETGFIKDISEKHPNGILVQHGEYSYIAPNGDEISVQYTADEHGFRAIGNHIPTPPPIPDEIQKGLDQIYAAIKIQQERKAERIKTDPEYAKTQQEHAQLDYNGQYYQDN